MANTIVSTTFSGAEFSSVSGSGVTGGETLSGTLESTYSPAGVLLDEEATVILSETVGGHVTTETFTTTGTAGIHSGVPPDTTSSSYEIYLEPAGSTGTGPLYSELHLDWTDPSTQFLYSGINYTDPMLRYSSLMAENDKSSSASGALASSPTSSSSTITCFAEGTHLLTPNGDVAVESLTEGDLVVTADGSEKPVIWLGHRSIDLRNTANPEGLYLVRITASAIAPNVPHRDLLITQEHCIFINGGLIPARMLVNGRSIIIDRSIQAFTYYHVELAQHGILLAEGLTTESYLDTGNRSNFSNAEAVAIRAGLSVNAGHSGWEHAAAPLMIGREFVEPVWQKFDARADELGFAAEKDGELSNDPDLHILAGNGAVIRPLRHNGAKYLFMLPAGETALRLVSRTARPSDTIGPFVDDRRELGVLVGEIAVYEGRKKSLLDAHLAAPDGAGWFGAANTAHRWTNGDAILQAPEMSMKQRAILEIEVVNAGPYKIMAGTEKTAVAA